MRAGQSLSPGRGHGAGCKKMRVKKGASTAKASLIEAWPQARSGAGQASQRQANARPLPLRPWRGGFCPAAGRSPEGTQGKGPGGSQTADPLQPPCQDVAGMPQTCRSACQRPVQLAANLSARSSDRSAASSCHAAAADLLLAWPASAGARTGGPSGGRRAGMRAGEKKFWLFSKNY